MYKLREWYLLRKQNIFIHLVSLKGRLVFATSNMAAPASFFHLLVILLGFSYLLSLSAVPVTSKHSSSSSSSFSIFRSLGLIWFRSRLIFLCAGTGNLMHGPLVPDQLAENSDQLVCTRFDWPTSPKKRKPTKSFSYISCFFVSIVLKLPLTHFSYN